MWGLFLEWKKYFIFNLCQWLHDSVYPKNAYIEMYTSNGYYLCHINYVSLNLLSTLIKFVVLIFKLNYFINIPVECSSFFLDLSCDHFCTCLHIDLSLICMFIKIRSVMKYSPGNNLDGARKNTGNCKSWVIMVIMPRPLLF